MFLGNDIANFLSAGLAFTISLAVFLLFKFVIIKNLKIFAGHTKNGIDDVIFDLLYSIHIVFYILISLYIASQFLNFAPFVKKIIDAVFVVVIVYQVITVINALLDYFLEKRVRETNGAAMTHIKDILQIIITFAFWTLGVLFILSNLGINITSLVAGLGIGGIAIALAVQSILGDLFSYFAIYFDKPFTRGDFVMVGTQMGVIEKIGIKTTRIRALQGEEIVISNSELTSSRIQNFKKMQERRVLFTFHVERDTPFEKLERIPNVIRDMITSIENTRFDRAHLFSLGESSYIYEVVYFVLSADYNEYMDIHQKINFGIIKYFEQEGINFAYPTRTVHLNQEAKA